VVKTADLVLVVCVPGQGDGIQAIKAGIMEIADLFIVNKADRDGADNVVMDIETMLELGLDTGRPKPSIIKTVATKGEGIAQLLEQTLGLLDSFDRKDTWQKERIREELIGLVEKEVVGLIKKKWNENNELEKAIELVIERKSNPYTIVQQVIAPLDGFFRKD
jgi:LAO/AO transport system kinase